MVKSNPLFARSMTHILENSNSKEVLPLLWRFWTPCQASQPGDLTKDRNSQGFWSWRPVGFDYKTFTGLGKRDTPVFDGTNKILHVPKPRGKRQWSYRRLNQNHTLVLEGLLWNVSQQGLITGMGTLAAACLEGPPWCKPSWRATYHRTYRSLCCVASGQTAHREGVQYPPQEIIGLKLYWSRPCQPEEDPVFPTANPSHQ